MLKFNTWQTTDMREERSVWYSNTSYVTKYSKKYHTFIFEIFWIRIPDMPSNYINLLWKIFHPTISLCLLVKFYHHMLKYLYFTFLAFDWMFLLIHIMFINHKRLFKPQGPSITYTDVFSFVYIFWLTLIIFTFLSNCKLVSEGFSIWLWILCNQSKNIIYRLQGLVDPKMPHQCVQSVFLLGETTCGTDLV
jgi:hypothetical protein